MVCQVNHEIESLSLKIRDLYDQLEEQENDVDHLIEQGIQWQAEKLELLDVLDQLEQRAFEATEDRDTLSHLMEEDEVMTARRKQLEVSD